MRRPAVDDPLWLGRYRVLAELDRDETARVLLGSGPDHRLVALRLPHLARDNGFRAEAAALNAASAVLEADPHASTPWLASEFVPGPSLRDVLETVGTLPGPALLRLAAGVAADLARLHDSGLVHGKLKPSAIRLTSGGARLIARATGGEPPDDVFALGSLLAAAADDALPEAIRPCLAENPADRPTAAELLEALSPSTDPWPDAVEQLIAEHTAQLRQFREDQPEPQDEGGSVIYQVAEPPHQPQPKRRPVPRRRLLIGALALVIAGLAAWLAWPDPPAPDALPPAPPPPLVESGFLVSRGHPQAATFSHDGRLLATLNTDFTLDLLDVATHKPVGQRIGPFPETGLTGLAFLPGDTALVASLLKDNKLTVQSWDPRSARETGEPLVLDHIDTDGGWPTLSDDGSMITVPKSSPRRLELWRVSDHTRVGSVETPGALRYAQFSPDGHRLAVYQWDGHSDHTSQLVLWDPASLRPVGKPIIWVDHERLAYFAFTPDNRGLITTSGGEAHSAAKVRQWDTATQEEVRLAFALAPPIDQRQGGNAYFTMVAPGLDDQHLLALASGALTVHDLDGRQNGAGVPGISSFTVSPDRKTVATTSDSTADRTVHLWHKP